MAQRQSSKARAPRHVLPSTATTLQVLCPCPVHTLSQLLDLLQASPTIAVTTRAPRRTETQKTTAKVHRHARISSCPHRSDPHVFACVSHSHGEANDLQKGPGEPEVREGHTPCGRRHVHSPQTPVVVVDDKEHLHLLGRAQSGLTWYLLALPRVKHTIDLHRTENPSSPRSPRTCCRRSATRQCPRRFPPSLPEPQPSSDGEQKKSSQDQRTHTHTRMHCRLAHALFPHLTRTPFPHPHDRRQHTSDTQRKKSPSAV